MKVGLVLGGGGLVGMGYHAGALKALDDWGIDPNGADLIVGTSAGAILGSYLRTGWSPGDFFDYAHGKHPRSQSTEGGQRDEVRRIFTPMWSDRSERARRAVGSLFAAASSRGLWRKIGGRIPSERLRRAFPSGLYSTEETLRRFEDDLPDDWPERPLYLCASDLYNGERVPFGKKGAPKARLPEAVLASTAIPGVFPPVRIGGRHYVDGGVLTATSLDLATDEGCRAVICIAPLGYRRDADAQLREDIRLLGPMAVRSLFARALKREVVAARADGVDVLVIRPWVTELKAHGTNSMRHFDRAALVSSAREGTIRLLKENSDHPAIEAFLKKSPKKEQVG